METSERKTDAAVREADHAEKRKQLFLRQKELLDTFLAHGAITPEQYRKSLGDLRVKMGMTDVG